MQRSRLSILKPEGRIAGDDPFIPCARTSAGADADGK